MLLGRKIRSLILWLEPPSFVTGDIHLCFGRLVLLSPIKSTHLIPSHTPTFPIHIPVHVPPQGCDRRLLHEGEERVLIDLVDERADGEMSLERREVAFVGTNRVRRQVLCDGCATGGIWCSRPTHPRAGGDMATLSWEWSYVCLWACCICFFGFVGFCWSYLLDLYQPLHGLHELLQTLTAHRVGERLVSQARAQRLRTPPSGQDRAQLARGTL